MTTDYMQKQKEHAEIAKLNKTGENMQSEIHTLKIKSWNPEELKNLTDFFLPVEKYFGLVFKKTALSRIIERIINSGAAVHASPGLVFGFIEIPVLGPLTVRNLEEILHKNGAVIISVNENGEPPEDTTLCIIEVENDEDNLPDYFLVASNGKYAEIKIENFEKD